MTKPAAVLIGTMGAGKSTVGAALAADLELGFRDTDQDVEASTGRSISDIFVESGESAFREMEVAAVTQALADHRGVLALGGGAVLDERTRAALVGHQIVYLTVDLSEAVTRVGLGASRPLLLGNIRSRIKKLMDERDPIYRSLATVTVATSGREVSDIVDEIRLALGSDAATPATRIPVDGPSPYVVVVGHGVLDQVPEMLGECQRVAVLHSPDLVDLAGRVAQAAGAPQTSMIELPDGEAAKSPEVAVRVWEQLGQAGFTRSDAVLTVGGGATTDMGGFIAATWLRGVRVVHVPTSLLAMVDAAVGGKTGMNTGTGKNLVGAFHEPAGVIVELDSLATLPPAELIAGLGEVIKCGFIADPRILELVEQSPQAALDPGSSVLRELIERAISVKAEVVARDLREVGGDADHPGREVLNYGHTLAHAIETNTGYAVRHGEAVALGMVFIAEVAAQLQQIDPDLVQRHRDILSSVGLPTTYAGVEFETVLATMRVDKKARGNNLRFVTLADQAASALPRPIVTTNPEVDVLEEAYRRLGGGS